jgi:hypothetical protein
MDRGRPNPTEEVAMINASSWRWIVSVSITAAALAASLPAVAAPGDTCVSAKVSAPFWLPDGVLHPAGTLMLCSVREFSPVANLHRLAVDGRPVGMFLSRKGIAEGRGALAPEVVFERDGAGNLKLLGYSVPTRGRSIAYRLPPARPARDAVAVVYGPATR